MSDRESTTKRLIRRAQEGDRRAVEALFAKAYPDLLQAARFRMGPVLRARMDTMDLAQTAYFEAYRDLARYRYRGKGSFFRWLLGILENKIRNRLDFVRAKKRDLRREIGLDGEGALAAPTGSPTRKLLKAEDRERLEAAMDGLPADYKAVIILRYYLRVPWREIGKEIGRSEEAAQMLCRRALLKLRALYGEQ